MASNIRSRKKIVLLVTIHNNLHDVLTTSIPVPVLDTHVPSAIHEWNQHDSTITNFREIKLN
jgi:hypothetical protein